MSTTLRIEERAVKFDSKRFVAVKLSIDPFVELKLTADRFVTLPDTEVKKLKEA